MKVFLRKLSKIFKSIHKEIFLLQGWINQHKCHVINHVHKCFQLNMGSRIICLSTFLFNWKNYTNDFSWTKYKNFDRWYSVLIDIPFLLTFRKNLKSIDMEQIKPPCTQNFIKKETLAQVFSCEFCEISKNIPFFKEHLWLLLMY